MLDTAMFPQVFFAKANQLSREKAFHYCRARDQKWVDMTWKRYRLEVAVIAGWLRKQGFKKGDAIALLASNRPEWMITDLAIMSIGAICVPVYATSSAKDIQYILEHSEAKFLIVDQLPRAEPAVKIKLDGILCFDPSSEEARKKFQCDVHDLADFHGNEDLAIEQPVDLAADDVATIIYTSGTTGRPKGVVHTHGNLAATFSTLYDILKNNDGQVDRFFSFLPLSHVAERVMVEMGSIVCGAEVAFARSIDTLADDLVRCRPTILLCVPRLWEKIYEKIVNGLSTASPVKKAVFTVARSLGSARIEGERINRNHDDSFGIKISDALVGNKLKKKLGLDRCRMLVTGAAPTRPEVMKFFGSFGMLIREVYGLTENLCMGVLNDYDESVIGSCGKAFVGTEIKIAADEEILFRAPWTFAGYFKNEEETRKVLDDDGWFHTGDLGKLDSEERLSIIGRKKELLKTSGGKYIAPVPIEDSIKSLGIIQDVMIIGDGRKYCAVLISLDEEATAGADHQSFRRDLEKHLSEVNKPLASYESIKRIGVMKEGFSVAGGTLTPTLKLKRSVAEKAKSDLISKVYEADETVVFE